MSRAMRVVMINEHPTNKRFAELADRLVCHLLYKRTMKALKIAQYLRKIHGGHLAPIVAKTGQSKGQ